MKILYYSIYVTSIVGIVDIVVQYSVGIVDSYYCILMTNEAVVFNIVILLTMYSVLLYWYYSTINTQCEEVMAWHWLVMWPIIQYWR